MSTNVTTIAVDLAKSVFQLSFADDEQHIVQRKRLTRAQFIRELTEHAPVHLVMEACGTAHFWGQLAQQQGHRGFKDTHFSRLNK